jgi:pyrroline-5-carboxylate reductase
MTLNKNIGFIGGGQMGEALIKGIIQAGLVKNDQVYVCEPVAARQEYLTETHGVNVSGEGDAVFAACRTIILAVKPQVMGKVLDMNKKHITGQHLLISIAAGITIGFLEEKAGPQSKVIRVMPNTPALVLEAASALSAGSNTTADDMKEAESIFNAIGKCVVLDESQLDAVTGLSGSGPAYVFSFIESMIDAGLKVGLSREVAETLTLQTLFGSVKLAMESNLHPAQLRANVTSPGGTTIAALHQLESAGFSGIIMDAVEAATKRSRELSSSG